MQKFFQVLLQSCLSSSVSWSNPSPRLSQQHGPTHGLGLVPHTKLYIYGRNADCAEGCCSRCPRMWLCLAVVLAGLCLLRRWHRERQTVPRLSEKSVLITGCDSGFGNLLARQLDARGLRVLAACLTDTGAAQLQAAASPRLQTILLDVTSSQSIAAAAAWVRERVGDAGLWGLVNNAGIAIPTGPNEWLTKGDFVKVLDVNLLGLIEVTLSLLPLLRRARGRVVNVASVMGRVSFFGGGYCISKFGVEAFSDSLRLEMHNFGVKVSIIEPGYFKTMLLNKENMENEILSLWERLPEETKTSYGEKYLKELLVGLNMLQKMCNSNLTLVTDCMEHALTSRYPRARYSAGWDAKLLYIPLSYLPSALTDTIFTWLYSKPAQKA
ncbi:retinol dehydrogenase 16 isoform X1 [Tyto alba]|uniref:retinol dehydrogenase 16 isoform X1 n=2 Tax=Tyto alba TaxID=56313 RepID=UPI001C67E5AB|nr:retinol dehydrogenase 16 isoform X1 [Tyto alba]